MYIYIYVYTHIYVWYCQFDCPPACCWREDILVWLVQCCRQRVPADTTGPLCMDMYHCACILSNYIMAINIGNVLHMLLVVSSFLSNSLFVMLNHILTTCGHIKHLVSCTCFWYMYLTDTVPVPGNLINSFTSQNEPWEGKNVLMCKLV